MNCKLFLGMLVCLCLTMGAVQAAGNNDFRPDPKPGQSQIEVVFVLDTTGSMSGLIQAAKDKIWSIVNVLGQAESAPFIRVGLVAYRDKGDAYVTKRTDLNNDLDAVYAELMKFEAQGGGDEPESVNQALHEAVTLMSWSNTSQAYKVIFLVGDCQPHMDYQDDVKYQESCKLAQAADVLINTIQCGGMKQTTPFWKEIAILGKGEFFQVAQEGGAVVIETPFDGKIAKLSQSFDATMLFYGDAKKQAEGLNKAHAAGSIAADASIVAQADRAAYNNNGAGRMRFRNANELFNDLENNVIKLKDVPKEQLPENIRKMTPAEQEKYINEQLALRKSLTQQIVDLNTQRQDYLKAEAEKTPDYKQSFDYLVLNCIKNQAANKNINYTISDKAPEPIPTPAPK